MSMASARNRAFANRRRSARQTEARFERSAARSQRRVPADDWNGLTLPARRSGPPIAMLRRAAVLYRIDGPGRRAGADGWRRPEVELRQLPCSLRLAVGDARLRGHGAQRAHGERARGGPPGSAERRDSWAAVTAKDRDTLHLRRARRSPRTARRPSGRHRRRSRPLCARPGLPAARRPVRPGRRGSSVAAGLTGGSAARERGRDDPKTRWPTPAPAPVLRCSRNT
jgi:hypothetical protein